MFNTMSASEKLQHRGLEKFNDTWYDYQLSCFHNKMLDRYKLCDVKMNLFNRVWNTKVSLNKNSMRVYVHKYEFPLFRIFPSKRSSYDKNNDSSKIRSVYSLNRTRNHLYDIVDCNSNFYTKFMTLTFKENLTDLKLANKKWNLFLLRFFRLFGFKLKYCRVVEFQKRGAVHFHCVIFNSSKLDFKKIKKCWTFGSVDIKKIDKTCNVAKYVAKYITKSMAVVPFNERITTFSRGLILPTIYKFYGWNFENLIHNFKLDYIINYDVENTGDNITYMFYVSFDKKRGGAPFGGVPPV